MIKKRKQGEKCITVNLVLDFDKTLTEEDTISALVAVAYKHHRSQKDSSSSPPLPPWSHFTAAYLSSLPKPSSSSSSSSSSEEEQSSSSPSSQLSPLQQLVHKTKQEDAVLLNAERASIERIEAAGLFRGVTLQELFEAGRSAVRQPHHDAHEDDDNEKKEKKGKGEGGPGVRLRPHWEACVRKVLCPQQPLSERGFVAVVSVNWSRAWIRGCLGLGSVSPSSSAFITSGNGVDGEGEEEGQHGIEGVRVEANEIMIDANGKSLGKLGRRWGDVGIWTAVGKERVLKELLQEQEQQQQLNQNGDDDTDDNEKGLRKRTVYVGDSEGDLLCLLHVDVGVIMRGDSNEMEALERKILHGLAGIKIRWAGEWNQRDESEKVIWWIRGFEELLNSGILD